jgi:hypothetical protein
MHQHEQPDRQPEQDHKRRDDADRSRQRWRAGRVEQADRVEHTRGDEGGGGNSKRPVPGAARLEQADQDQPDRRIFGEVAMRADGRGQSVFAGVAESSFVLHPHADRRDRQKHL